MKTINKLLCSHYYKVVSGSSNSKPRWLNEFVSDFYVHPMIKRGAECLTRDRGAVGVCLNGVTAACP